jgi:hypothetical protein
MVVRLSSGAALVKQGGLGAAWVYEYSAGVVGTALAG